MRKVSHDMRVGRSNADTTSETLEMPRSGKA